MSERKLVGTEKMFKDALAGKYAIGAYNVNNMEIVQGIVEAAEEKPKKKAVAKKTAKVAETEETKA